MLIRLQCVKRTLTRNGKQCHDTLSTTTSLNDESLDCHSDLERANTEEAVYVFSSRTSFIRWHFAECRWAMDETPKWDICNIYWQSILSITRTNTHTHTHTHTHVSLLTVYIHRISQQTGQFVSLDVNAYRGAEYNWQCKFFGKFCRCLLLTAFCQLCGFLFSDKNFDIVSKNRKTVTNHYSLLLGWLKKIDTDFQNNKIQANSHLLLKYYLYCFKIERRYRQQLRIYFFLHAVYVQ